MTSDLWDSLDSSRLPERRGERYSLGVPGSGSYMRHASSPASVTADDRLSLRPDEFACSCARREVVARDLRAQSSLFQATLLTRLSGCGPMGEPDGLVYVVAAYSAAVVAQLGTWLAVTGRLRLQELKFGTRRSARQAVLEGPFDQLGGQHDSREDRHEPDRPHRCEVLVSQ